MHFSPLGCPCLSHYFFTLPRSVSLSRLHFQEQRCVCFERLLHHTCLFKLQMTLETKRACLCRLPRYSLWLPTTQDSLYLSPFSRSPPLSLSLSTTLSLGNNSYNYSRTLNTARAPQLSPI